MKYVHILLIVTAYLLLPGNVQAEPRTIHVEWQYPYNGVIDGFRLYHLNSQICETRDPAATSLDCNVDFPDGAAEFYMTSFRADGSESEPSAPLTYIFSSALQAKFTIDNLEGVSPLRVAFDASGSTGSIISYNWIFGDGETASGRTVTHLYTLQGTYTATLVVKDNLGATHRQSTSIVVNPPAAAKIPPKAVISASKAVGKTPLQISFDATGSSDADGTIVSYAWDMGDGGAATGAKVDYTYTTPGTYNPVLLVTDDTGLTDTATTPVIVDEPASTTNSPPAAIITITSSSGYAPLTVRFTADKSYDPDGQIDSYTWNFGDGSSAEGPSVTHTFYQPANYQVSLKVTDNSGATDTTRRVIKVKDSSHKPAQKRLPPSILSVYKLLLKGAKGNEAP